MKNILVILLSSIIVSARISPDEGTISFKDQYVDHIHWIIDQIYNVYDSFQGCDVSWEHLAAQVYYFRDIDNDITSVLTSSQKPTFKFIVTRFLDNNNSNYIKCGFNTNCVNCLLRCKMTYLFAVNEEKSGCYSEENTGEYLKINGHLIHHPSLVRECFGPNSEIVSNIIDYQEEKIQ